MRETKNMQYFSKCVAFTHEAPSVCAVEIFIMSLSVSKKENICIIRFRMILFLPTKVISTTCTEKTFIVNHGSEFLQLLNMYKTSC